MKRLLLAACLAIGVHVAFFSIQTRWTMPTRLMPQNRSVTISLSEAPPAPPQKVLPQPKKRSLPKPKPKPKPIKAPAPVVAPEPEPVLSTVPEPTPEPLPESEDLEPDLAQPQANETPPPAKIQNSQIPGPQEGAVIQSSVPRYDINPSPTYPQVAKRRGYEGTVVLEVLVTREGRVGQIRVGQSSGYTILDRRALNTVGKWIFTPALRGTESVEMWVEVPIEFELK